jgi:hypothetical protein
LQKTKGIIIPPQNAMLLARCFSLIRLVAVTLPQGGINDEKKWAHTFSRFLLMVEESFMNTPSFSNFYEVYP